MKQREAITDKAALSLLAQKLWQGCQIIPLGELERELQEKILILRNHPEVCKVSHSTRPISLEKHLAYLEELSRPQPLFDCCALYCPQIERSEHFKQLQPQSELPQLMPILGILSLDLRQADYPLLGIYKNLYYYHNIPMGRYLLYAVLQRASQLGISQLHLECYSSNLAMQNLAVRAGFIREEPRSQIISAEQVAGEAAFDSRGKILSYQRYVPSQRQLQKSCAL